MKTVYFVRHGESEGNAAMIFQSPESPLTENGLAQAKLIAKRCVRLPIEMIISSTMTRARQTAEKIAKKIKKPIEFSDLFVERRRPDEVRGKHIDDPEIAEIRRALSENYQIDGARYSNEENFNDMKARAERALEFLENRKEDNILVVTHGLFLRILIARVIFGRELTGREGVRFVEKTATKNTGITVITDDSKKFREDSPWRLHVWNDHAHLG